MSSEAETLERVRRALRSEPRIRDGGQPTRLALEVAARISGAAGIVDRLHVTPSVPMGDGEIRDHLRDAMLGEPVLADCILRTRSKGHVDTVREPPAPSGSIEISVQNGVVTLDGDVAGLGQKRLAGVLAWWLPGSRDVINGLGVTPPEADSDDAVTDAVKQVLEKDPCVSAIAVEVGTRKAVVTLLGSVPNEEQHRAAEADAWYVFGVDDVDNRLDVQP